MSSEQSTELSAGARRRIVALPARAEAPVALIMRDNEQRDALTEHLGRRRVVAFPSLAHFLTEEQKRVPWAGIVVGYACAWDAQLDAFVPHRSCVALYQVSEEDYAWPEAVTRLEGQEQLDAWVTDLLSPNPAWKKALEEARKKPRRKTAREAAEKRAELSRQLELAVNGISTDKAGKAAAAQAGEASQAGAQVASAGAAQAEAKPSAPEKRAKPKAAQPRASKIEARPRKVKVTARADQRQVREAARQVALPLPRMRHRPELYRLGSTAGLDARLERELVRLAGEIGLARARALLDTLHQNASQARAR